MKLPDDSDINLEEGVYIKYDPHKAIYTQRQMAQQRGHTMQSLPCVGTNEPEDLDPERAPSGASRPNPGGQRGSTKGLAFNAQHPTNNPLLPATDPFDKSKILTRFGRY